MIKSGQRSRLGRLREPRRSTCRCPRSYGAGGISRKVQKMRDEQAQTTGWQPAMTAPQDFSVIEIRYLDPSETWGFSCRRRTDGTFIDLEGNPIERTPDEWRVENL